MNCGNIKNLNLIGNPVVEEKGDSFKVEVCMRVLDNLSYLARLNKEDITNEEKVEIANEKAEREKARLEAEE